jgi:hypothetical protein
MKVTVWSIEKLLGVLVGETLVLPSAFVALKYAPDVANASRNVRNVARSARKVPRTSTRKDAG